ncbi:MAG: endonuclease III [Nitrospirae bacterium]|nr:MAG: endonuclease III [Nitrospirota bacterium]
MDIRAKVAAITKRLGKEYPDPRIELHFNSPFEVLVATILSAQTTDAHVNRVTPVLFRKYRSVKDYAAVPLETLQKDLSSINFFNTKARNIKASAEMILREFNGTIPTSMEELIRLPGVARKTANIVLSTVYGINEGIAVDTHVKRLAGRLGLTAFDDPVRIEKDLMKAAPQKDWARLSHLLIYHGRRVCQARKPNHQECVLADICPSRDI